MAKILYFIPFAIGCILYTFLGLAVSFGAIDPFVWIALGMLCISGLLMNKGKCWGCVFGILVGILLIYMGTRETGQIIKETPFGIVICTYYVICAIVSYKRGRN